jgi:transposase InsO family protein
MEFCNEHGIKMQLSIARTPQQNEVVERNNKTLQEMDRTILMDSKLKEVFWV